MKTLLAFFFAVLSLSAVCGEYTLDLPTGGADGRIVAIELSGENLRNLGGHAAWLRLYDANGNLVPWARETATAKLADYAIKSTPLHIDLVRKTDHGGLEISFHAAPDAALNDEVFLHFRTNVRNFWQNVLIWGKEAGGEERPLPIIGEGYIFDSSSNLDARKLDIKFAPGKCREFRVLLSEANLERQKPEQAVAVTTGTDAESETKKMVLVTEPFSITSLELNSRQLDESRTAELSQSLSVPFEVVKSKPGQSVYLVKPGAWPVKGLDFEFQEENYSRKVTVRQLYPNGEKRLAGEGTVSRFNMSRFGSLNSISLSDVREGTLEVTFEDNDNPPLHLAEVKVNLPIYRLKFIAADSMFPLKLTASPHSDEPVYDVASILALGGNQQNAIILRPEKFIGEPVTTVDKLGVPRIVLYLAIVLAVVAMAIALYRALPSK